jgi:hypothetical protein
MRIAFMNAVRQLDSGNGNGRMPNDLKPVMEAHRRLIARWSCWWVGTSLEAVAHCGAAVIRNNWITTAYTAQSGYGIIGS